MWNNKILIHRRTLLDYFFMNLHQEYYYGVRLEVIKNNTKICIRLLGRSAAIRNNLGDQVKGK